MIIARVAYVLIVAVIVVAVAAIVFVLRPEDEPPSIEAAQVVQFAQFGVVQSIRQDGRTLTVRFKGDFDTEDALGTDEHVFESTLADGADIRSMLEQAGVAVNGEGGLQVTTR